MMNVVCNDKCLKCKYLYNDFYCKKLKKPVVIEIGQIMPYCECSSYEEKSFIPPDGCVIISTELYKKMEEENRNMRNIIKNMRKIKDLSNSLLERIDYIDDGDHYGCESG